MSELKIELFHAPGYEQCAAATAALKVVACQVAPDLSWRDMNVLDELDHAVDLGVFTLPALVIDQELVFTSLPSPKQLRKALLERTKGRDR